MILGDNHPAVFLLCLTFEGVVFGMAVILFAQSFTVLRKHSGNLVLLLANSLIFLFAIIHMIGVSARTYRAFITSPDGPEEYYKQITNPETVVAEVGQFGALIISDALSVWRVWKILRGAKWRTIVPAVGWLATLATAIAEIQIQKAHQDPTDRSFFSPLIFKLTLSYLVASLFTTVASTVLIAWDLWRADRTAHHRSVDNESYDGEGKKQSLPLKAMRIFVESAALYSIVNLLWMVWFASKSIPEAVFSTLGPSVSSITFSLIVLRLARAVRGPVTVTVRSSGHQMSSLNQNAHLDGAQTITYGPVGGLPDDV